MSIADYSLQAFSKEIISELQEENKLASEYTKLLASAKIPFDGEERNLSGLGPYMTSPFRDEREKASKAYYGYFEENEEKFDEIFDKLVKLRHKMAKKLGFDNFVQLGYIRMLRTDYNSEMVAKFRKQVSEYIVPVASKLYDRQKQRLGLQKLRYFDENFEFNSGNAKPKGDSQFIMNNGRLMYSELSKETDEFFKYMLEHELMDLETKKVRVLEDIVLIYQIIKRHLYFQTLTQQQMI
ncbi:peptidase M3 family protein [[Clostridium] sordellii ATCC 9714]|nr:peptidase M3 family protein [[Clostridium] sordellii ATCC 9714] [Paeniclostridium sordellii ATCC 9714]